MRSQVLLFLTIFAVLVSFQSNADLIQLQKQLSVREMRLLMQKQLYRRYQQHHRSWIMSYNC